MFTVTKSGRIRKGELVTNHGTLKTPFFMPIATKGSMRAVNTIEVKERLNSPILLLNTYHLYLRPGSDLVRQLGGLHTFINWERPILTDSGGYQVFSLSKMRKISEEGATFRSHIDGSKHILTPEESIRTQFNLGSDIQMVLDECPPGTASKYYVEKSLALTTRWAKRSKDALDKFYVEESEEEKARRGMKNRPLQFGIVQGGTHEDLRKESLRQLQEIGFDGYAIGGVSVGEARSEVLKVIKWIAPLLPEDKPRYLMGLGKPEEIVYAVSFGVDMFDCVIPSREARHGAVYTWQTPNKKEVLTKYFQELLETRQEAKLPEEKFYTSIKIKREEYRDDMLPIDENCSCFTCQNYSRAYIRHLLTVDETVAYELLTIHNVHFYLEMMQLLQEMKG
jgi:queuine tRNA-ribosyltransferase